jgi:cytochrome b6-f complex iron-sulfur subunit
MKRYVNRAAKAMLADQPLPRARLDDPEEIEAVATAIALRAARPGAGRPDEEFVTRLSRLLAAEWADESLPNKLPRRAALVGAGAAVVGLTAALVGGTIVAPEPRVAHGYMPEPDLVPDGGQWTAVMAESELSHGSVRRFSSQSAIGFVVEEGGAVTAVSGVCTHRGCILQVDPAGGRLNCPCHRAVFSLGGTLLSSEISPPPGPLPRIPTRRRDGHIELLLARSDGSSGSQ